MCPSLRIHDPDYFVENFASDLQPERRGRIIASGEEIYITLTTIRQRDLPHLVETRPAIRAPMFRQRVGLSRTA